MGKFTHLKPLLSNTGLTRFLATSNFGNELKMEDILDKELKRKIEVKKCPKPRDFYLILRTRDAKKMKKKRQEEVDYFSNLNQKAVDLNENGSLDSLARLINLSSKKELLRKYQDNKSEFIQRARNICKKAELEESRAKLNRILRQQNKQKQENDKKLDAKKIQSKALTLKTPIIYKFPEIKKIKSKEHQKKLMKAKKLGKTSTHKALRKFNKIVLKNVKKPNVSSRAKKLISMDIPDEIELKPVQYSRPNNADFKRQIEDKLAAISKKIKYLEAFRNKHSAKCNFCRVNPNPKPTKITKKKPDIKESPKMEKYVCKPCQKFLSKSGPDIFDLGSLMNQKELIKQSAPTKFTAFANAILTEKQELDKGLFSRIFENDAVNFANPNEPKIVPSPFAKILAGQNKYKELFAKDIFELNKPLQILDGIRIKPKNSKHQKLNFLVPSLSAGKILNVDNVRYSTVDSKSYHGDPDKEIKPGTQLKYETARVYHAEEEEELNLSQVSEDFEVKEEDLVDLKDRTARIYEIKQLTTTHERLNRDLNNCWHKKENKVQPSYEVFSTSKTEKEEEELDLTSQEHEYNLTDVLKLNKKQEEFNKAMREPEVWKNPSHNSKSSTIESPVFEDYFETLKKEQMVEASTINQSNKEEEFLDNSSLSQDLTKMIDEQMESYLSRNNVDVESCKCRQQIVQENDTILASDRENLETPTSDERPEIIKPEDNWSNQEKPLGKMEPDDDWLADNSCVKKPPNQYDLKSDTNSIFTLDAVRTLTLQTKLAPKISDLGQDRIYASKTVETVEKTLSESTEVDSNRLLDQESTGDRDNLELLATDTAANKENIRKIPTVECSTIDRLEKNDNYQEIYPFGFLKSASKSQNWLKEPNTKIFSDEIEVKDNKFTMIRTQEGLKDKKLTSGFIEAKTRKCKCGKDFGHETGKDLDFEPLVYGIFLQLFLIGEAVAKHSLERKKVDTKKDKKLVDNIKEDKDLVSKIYAASQSVVGLNSIAQKLEDAVNLIQQMAPSKSFSESCVISRGGISETSTSKNMDEKAIENLYKDVMSYVKKNQDSTLSTGSEVPTCLNETVVCEDTQSGTSLMSLNSKSTTNPQIFMANPDLDIIEETCKIAKDLVKETQEILKISPISITEANKFLEILGQLKDKDSKIEEKSTKKQEDPDWLFKDVQTMKTPSTKSFPNLTIDELWENHKEKAVNEVKKSKKAMIETFEDSKNLSDHHTVTVDKIVDNNVQNTVDNKVDNIIDNSVDNSDKAVCDLFRRDSESMAKNRTSDENKYNDTDYQQLSWDYQFPELSSYFKQSHVDRDGSELRQTKSEQLLEGMNQETEIKSTKKEEKLKKVVTENVEEEKHNHRHDYPLNIIRVVGNFFKGECKVCKKLSLMLEKDTDEEGINRILEDIKRNQNQCSTSSKSACQLHEKKRKCSTSCYTAKIYKSGKNGSRKGDSGKEVKVIMDRFKWRNNDDIIIGSITKFVDVTKKRYCTLIDDFGDDEKKRELIKRNSCPECLTENPGKIQNQKPYVLKRSRIEPKEELIIPEDSKSMKYRIFDKNDQQILINKLKIQSCKEKLQEEKNLISSNKDVNVIKPKTKKVENVRKIHNIGHALNFKYVPSLDLFQKRVKSDYFLKKRNNFDQHKTKSNINLKVSKNYLLKNVQSKDYGTFQLDENDSLSEYKIDIKNNDHNLELNLTLDKNPEITEIFTKKKPAKIISKTYNTSEIFYDEILRPKNCPIAMDVFKPVEQTDDGKIRSTIFNIQELIDEDENVDDLLEITLQNVEDNLLKPQIILPDTNEIILPSVFTISVQPSFTNIKKQIDTEIKELENLMVEPQTISNIYLDGLTQIFENKKCCETAKPEKRKSLKKRKS